MTGSKHFHIVFMIVSMVSVPVAALAQTDGGTGLEREDDCIVDPGDQDEAQGETESLTETLERCNGILKPENTGDSEIVEPAPDTGKMPVIPPGQVPQQAPEE